MQLSIERGEKIAEDVFEMIVGTHLDSGAYQDQIKGLTHIEQRVEVNRDLDKRRREQQAYEKQSRDDHEARIGVEWIVDAIGRNNILALITILSPYHYESSAPNSGALKQPPVQPKAESPRHPVTRTAGAIAEPNFYDYAGVVGAEPKTLTPLLAR